jgi:hypothetical protein
MNNKELESRIAALEQKVADLQKRAGDSLGNPWRKIIGHFKDDPIFDEIVRLGRVYRDSQDRKKSPKKSPRKS